VLHRVKHSDRVKFSSSRTTSWRSAFEFVSDLTRRFWAHREVWIASIVLDIVAILLVIILLAAH
jgi:hypothetical protein